jgi:hypothetical protein
MEKMLLELQVLLTKIQYPGDNERHLSYYIDEAEELLNDIVDEQNRISKLIDNL